MSRKKKNIPLDDTQPNPVISQRPWYRRKSFLITAIIGLILFCGLITPPPEEEPIVFITEVVRVVTATPLPITSTFTPTPTPTVTYTATATATNLPTSTYTAIPLPSPTSSATIPVVLPTLGVDIQALEQDVLALEPVDRVDVAMVNNGIGYFEICGVNTLETALDVLRIALFYESNLTEFTINIDDAGAPISYTQDIEGRWRTIPLSDEIAPCDDLYLVPTFTASATPVSVAVTPTSKPVSQMFYATGAGNLRPCPNTSDACGVIGTAIYGEELAIVEIVEGEPYQGITTWYGFERDGDLAYLHGFFVSDTPPPIQEQVVVPVVIPSSNVNNSSSAPQPVSPVTGAAPPCMNNFDFSVCESYQPAPTSCDEVVARGIPERVAACCFPARDRDKDGLACYGT